MTPPRWIRTPEELHALVASLQDSKALCIDTEADGLHHHPVKLCLVQVADDAGRGHLVDPLALPTLEPLGDLFAAAGVVKILHAADNDLGYLKRLYGLPSPTSSTRHRRAPRRDIAALDGPCATSWRDPGPAPEGRLVQASVRRREPMLNDVHLTAARGLRRRCGPAGSAGSQENAPSRAMPAREGK
jgi:hypothetical protein